MNRREERYNGWENYETWIVKLWIDRKESWYDHWRVRAEELKEEGGDIMLLLSEELKYAFDDGDPLKEEGVFTDLLNSALSEVNWDEIAGSILAQGSK
jgi:hypothetical protein